MLNKGIETVTQALETVVSKVEELDLSAAQRPVVFGKSQTSAQDQIELENTQKDKLTRLRVVTGDLLDLWLFEGSRGLHYLQESKAYKLTDPYINYIAKYEQVKESSLKMTSTITQTISELNQRVIIYVDEATNFVGMLVKVLRERQASLVEYISKTYSNVTVFVQDNWLRLDFNQDGSVSIEDLRKGLSQLYEFLKSYDYIEATTRIKSQIYEEAQKYIKTNQTRSQDSAEDDIPFTSPALSSQPVAQVSQQPKVEIASNQVLPSQQVTQTQTGETLQKANLDQQKSQELIGTQEEEELKDTLAEKFYDSKTDENVESGSKKAKKGSRK